MMMTLISLRVRDQKNPLDVTDSTSIRNWWHKCWNAFIVWLTEPIPFPGKWPEEKASARRYNENNQRERDNLR
jgi:hypothetical protein